MDWLTEADAALPELKRRAQRKDAGWIDLYAYISCIDVILEATEQMHRCVFGRGKKSTKLAFSSRHLVCRPGELEHLSDRDFFKELRSAFGAHPVNLKDTRKSHIASVEAKRFACWVLTPARGQMTGDFDFSVLLYSNLRGVEDIRLGVKLSELDAYCTQYRKYRKTIFIEIKRQYQLFADGCRKRLVERNSDPVAQWRILEQEARDRAPHLCDADVPEIFQVSPSAQRNREILLSYQNEVSKLMRQMVSVFQRMNNRSICALYEKASRVLYPPYPQVEGLSYCLSKLLTGASPYAALKTEIETFFRAQIDFHSLRSDKERRVLVRAALFSLST
jgi:hypothetical protein